MRAGTASAAGTRSEPPYPLVIFGTGGELIKGLVKPVPNNPAGAKSLDAALLAGCGNSGAEIALI